MMNNNFKTELQKFIESKQLVEINLRGAPTYKVAYILGVDDQYLTFIEVSSSATFSGVTVCLLDDVDSVSVETIYLSELSKQITDDSIYQQALESVGDFKDFTFNGFIDCFKDTKTVVELTTENEDTISGRIVQGNDEVLVFDEYSSESDRRIGRTYFKVSTIIRLSIEVPWLRTISRSLADKNL